MPLLRTKTFHISINLQSEICQSFKKPLVFYLAHKNDARLFFYTFVILNFQKKELDYVVSYLPENISAVENHPRSHFFRINSMLANPHSVIQIKKDESFLAFFETAPFFFQIDYLRNTLRVQSGKILKKNDDEIAISFSPTVFKDDINPDFFYFSSLIKNRHTRKKSLRFYRSSLDLSETEEIYSRPTTRTLTPHTTRKIDHFLVNSNFLNHQLKNLQTGEIFENIHRYSLYVYEALYEEYCKGKNIPYSEEDFENKNHISLRDWDIRLETEFAAFCLSKGKHFLDICKKNPAYSFSPIPGSILLIDLETKNEQLAKTTFCAPAHFEIDEKTGDIFISSHNFTITDRRHFFGPAAIDRFRLENGGLIRIATFSHPTGYRFTSHKVFSYANKTYLCTFGQPNRLFFIDAETMELLFFEDIDIDLLSHQTDTAYFLNTVDLEAFVMKAVEVSADGQFIFFLSYDHMYFYSFPERRIVQKIRFNEDIYLDGGSSPADFYNITTHIGSLS